MMGSGKGWSNFETVAACKAFVAASEDPKSGAGKKKEEFHEILNVLNNIVNDEKARERGFKPPPRTGSAILQRYKKARCDCIKSDYIIMRMHAKTPTGAPSDGDFIRGCDCGFQCRSGHQQHALFFQDKDLDPGPKFQFLDALLFLRSTRQWDLVVQSRLDGRKTDQGKVEIGEMAGGGGGSSDILASEANDVEESTVPHFTPEKAVRVRGKRANAFSSLANELHRGTDGIEQLVKPAKRRNDIAEQLLDVEKQKAITDLFRLPGTRAILRNRYLRVSQSVALKRLEKIFDPADENLIDERSRNGPRSSSFLPSEDRGASPEMLITDMSGSAEKISAVSNEENHLSSLQTTADIVRTDPNSTT